jgi:hypothetical protein
VRTHRVVGVASKITIFNADRTRVVAALMGKAATPVHRYFILIDL